MAKTVAEIMAEKAKGGKPGGASKPVPVAKAATLPPASPAVRDAGVLEISYVNPDELHPWEKNPRINDEAAVKLAEEIRSKGFRQPIVATRDGMIRAGHTRWKAARLLGLDNVPVIYQDFASEEEAEAFAISDNRVAEESKWDVEQLAAVMGAWEKQHGLAVVQRMTGFAQKELEAILHPEEGGQIGEGAGSLARRFGVPPFTVLDARQGYWRERKAAWMALGIKSELGRLDVAVYTHKDRLFGMMEGTARNLPGKTVSIRCPVAYPKTPVGMPGGMAGVPKGSTGHRMPLPGPHNSSPDYMVKRGKAAVGSGSGGQRSQPKALLDRYAKSPNSLANRLDRKQEGEGYLHARPDVDGLKGYETGVSIFDPVLCELMYAWFAPRPGGDGASEPPIVLDPFAGGSVRGLVAAAMGLRYVGVDLSGEQIAANRKQVEGFKARLGTFGRWAVDPQWVEGDAAGLPTLGELPPAVDLVFTCPPYFNLEVYSNHPNDLSACGNYGLFIDGMTAVLQGANARLKENRFLVMVLGDLRNGAGFNYGLIADTIKVAQGLGLGLYNEAILLTAVGSLPVRVGKQFSVNRKLGRAHQYVLVFYKGDPKAIKLVFDTTIPLPELEGVAEEGGGDGTA